MNTAVFSTLLEPSHLFSMIALALSIFNLVAFLWLAITVWLNGDRRTGIVRLGFIGLGLSALFFYIQALLIFTPSPTTPGLISQDVLWRMIWLPALGVPYIWFAIGLHYAALINEGWRKRRPFLLVISGLFGSLVFLLLILNSSTFTFAGTLRLLATSDSFDDTGGNLLSPVLLPILFLCYVTFCAIGPWFTPGRIRRLLRILKEALVLQLSRLVKRRGRRMESAPLRFAGVPSADVPARSRTSPVGMKSLPRALIDAFWDDPTDVELLEEPALSWHLARPKLLLAALLMVCLNTTLGGLVLQSTIGWLENGQKSSPASLSSTLQGATGIASSTPLPLNLLLLDLLATGAVAIIILLIGYSIVRHGILIERPLARRGFFEQWRGIVIVATAVAILIALLVNLTHSSLGGLLLITSLATVAYALFTWSSYTAHDRFITLLGPFVRSSNLRHWLNTDREKTEQDLKNVFFSLCHDVLAVQCAYLAVMAGTIRRSYSFRWPEEALPDSRLMDSPRGPRDGQSSRLAMQRTARDAGASRAPKRVQISLRGQSMICWVLPIYDERGLVATLYLGPREDGAAFTDEDMNLAHACGQRMLDALGDHEAMQAVAGLLRRRIVNVKLLDAQQRRLLHDEILPQMHLALLRLEMLRTVPAGSGERSPVVGAGEDVDEGRGPLWGLWGAPALGVSSPVQDDAAPTAGGHKGPIPSSPPLPPLQIRGQNGRAIMQSLATSHIDEIENTHEQLLNEAIEMISDAHRRLAAMMRATAPGAPHRLEQNGLVHAIHTMLEQDFSNAFDEVDWCVCDEAAAHIDEVTPPAVAELIFAAVQEALRNAARHARGSDVHRHLRLALKASWSSADASLEIIVADDGVGISSESSSTTGTGGGLLTHSALLAIAGGSLTIKSAPGEGVTVRIFLPGESLK